MKFLLRPLLTLLVACGTALLLTAAGQLYTCGMHPQIIRDQPGDCPICGMKLQPVRAATAAPENAAGATVAVDGATVQRMNLQTALVGHGPVRREFRTVGAVTLNEQGLHDVTLKYDGWLEKLDVDTTWARVHAGDPLCEVYAPDLYNAQLNFLVAVQSESGAPGPLTRAARARLELFDASAEFIDALAQSKVAQRTFTVRAPADGVVIEKMGIAGQMMKAGERIYRLADLSTVWVLAQVYEQDLPFVHEGEPVTVHATYGPERHFDGRVALVLPQVEETTRTATARIVLENPDGFLRPGMYTDVNFSAQLAEDAVLVPDMAVLRSGEQNTVFVARDHGTFEPRQIKLGARSADGTYEVLSGLRAGERVVISGQFLLDSESQLREAIQKMLASPSGTPAR
jgi:membrane fusion protein, copper/silver efflux system